MIGYIAIGNPWSYKTAGGTELEAVNYLHRVHGYPHPTVFKGVRSAFRAIRENYDYIAQTRGFGVHGHLRVLDLACLPILRFEDLSFDDRRAILHSKARAELSAEPTAEAMLQKTVDLSVPRVDEADPVELYAQLQVAERQMQLWTERCDKIRREFDYVKHATPVQKARRRQRKGRSRDSGFNAPELAPAVNPHAHDDPMDPTQGWPPPDGDDDYVPPHIRDADD